MESNNDLKTQRIKGYFLEAAKQIILTEGVEGVSARKIAKIAGYSYATTYNYFKDIDELLSQTKALLVEEVMVYMEETMDFSIKSMEDMKTVLSKYVRYYLAHPNIFKFFYFYKLSENEAAKEAYNFEVAWASAFRFLVENGDIKESEVESCAKSLIYAIHGLMALFFSGNGMTEETIFMDLDKVIACILRG